jgi:hypothetical protein
MGNVNESANETAHPVELPGALKNSQEYKKSHNDILPPSASSSTKVLIFYFSLLSFHVRLSKSDASSLDLTRPSSPVLLHDAGSPSISKVAVRVNDSNNPDSLTVTSRTQLIFKMKLSILLLSLAIPRFPFQNQHSPQILTFQLK